MEDFRNTCIFSHDDGIANQLIFKGLPIPLCNYIVTKYQSNLNFVNVIDSDNNINLICDSVNGESHLDTIENLLIVEGSTEIGENGFITKLTKVYPVLKKFHMIEKNRIDEIKALRSDASKSYKKTILLVDKDFKPYERSCQHNDNIKEDEDGIYKLYLELPCSESHLILNYFKKANRENITMKLEDYFKNNVNKQKFLNGFNYAVPKDPKYEGRGEEIWNEALLEIKKENPDYVLIVSVIHGHRWVGMLKNKRRYKDINVNNSRDWYKKEDFSDFDPAVYGFLDKMIKRICDICGY